MEVRTFGNVKVWGLGNLEVHYWFSGIIELWLVRDMPLAEVLASVVWLKLVFRRCGGRGDGAEGRHTEASPNITGWSH